MSSSPLVQLWIWISAAATLAGWTLSACGELNRAGYAFTFIVFAVFAFVNRRQLPWPEHFRPLKFLRRFRRPLPMCFAGLAALIFISGLIYAPDNYTGLTYRVGRVLQWISHDHWIWVHTSDYRMNDRACGMEWIIAPVLLFARSIRPLFLLNFLPYLLLPGLVFSVLIRLGVRRGVAWQWMWLLPTGYNFLLQAGSLANDTFPTVYALAAVDFALRAAKSKKFSDAAASIVAAGLLVGAKASNLPLLLPWFILMFPLLPVFRKKIIALAPALLLAAIVSFLPTAILNTIYCRDWSGAVLESPIMTVKNPLAAGIGNGFQLLVQNFCPPLFPMASWWNARAAEIMPAALVSISKHFDTGFFQLGELPTEDSAGIGFGLCVLLAVLVVAQLLQWRPSSWLTARGLILISPWLALSAYCAKSGMTSAARLIAPYYPLLLPLLLAGPAAAWVVRRHWWRALVYASLFLALLVLILTPDRPLWPARAVLSRLAARHPQSHSLARAFEVYSVYGHRSDSLAQVRTLLPPNVKAVGFLGGPDDCDLSLWLPLGSRRVEHFLLSDAPERFREDDIEYAVVGGANLIYNQTTLADWLARMNAQAIAATNATEKVNEGPQMWYVVRLPP